MSKCGSNYKIANCTVEGELIGAVSWSNTELFYLTSLFVLHFFFNNNYTGCFCFLLELSEVTSFSIKVTWSSVPPKIHKWISYSKVESVGSCKFQIHLCILACVMSREFTRDSVTKFLPAQLPWIWCKCLLRKLIHSKIFNMTKYREVLVKYSPLIAHTGMPIWIWHYLRERVTDSLFK